MTGFNEAFLNLRYFLRKNFIEPVDATVLVELKDATDFAKFDRGLRDELTPMMYGVCNSYDMGVLLGIPFTTRIAKPKPDGKEYSCDIAAGDKLQDITMAINTAIERLRLEGVTEITNVSLSHRVSESTVGLTWVGVRVMGNRK